MTTIVLSNLKAGEKVSVAYCGRSQGVYIVKNANKVRVVLTRETDGYERTFSSRTGLEKNAIEYHSAYIESIQDMEIREAYSQKLKSINDAWSQVLDATNRKNVDALIASTDALKLLLGV